MVEDKLYSAIEAAIIHWNLDGIKTAGELTREIMSILKEQDKKAKKEEKRRKGFSKWFAKAWEKSINSPDNHAEDWNY
jgi:hypothetical protein